MSTINLLSKRKHYANSVSRTPSVKETQTGQLAPLLPMDQATSEMGNT